jgi:hypothetical protein
MVDAIEKFPDAGLALLTNGIEPDLPWSGKLEHLEFFGVILSDAVSAAWGFCGRYSPQVLPGRGGFGGRRFVRDTELWLKLAERWPVVLLPPALVWWG